MNPRSRTRTLALLAAAALGAPCVPDGANAQVSPTPLADSAQSLERLADSVAKRLTPANGAQALQLYTNALALYRGTRGHVGEARVLTAIARIYRTFGRPDSSLAYFRQALATSRASGNRLIEAAALQGIGNVNAALGRPDTALAYFAQALAIRREAGDRAGQAGSLQSIGVVNRLLGRPDSALAYFGHALVLHRAAANRSGEAATLLNMGNANNDLGRPDSALASFQAALLLYRETGERAGEGAALGSLGNVHRDVGRPDSALTYYAQALAITRESGDQAAVGGTLQNIANVYSHLGRSDSALVYYREALGTHRVTRNRAAEGATLANIAGVHTDLGRSDSALAHYAQALAIQREVGDRKGEGITLQNVGGVHRDLGRPDSALRSYRDALAIHRQVRNRKDESNTLHNIGILQSDFGRPDSALAYLRLALAIRREITDRSGEGATLHGIGSVNRQLGHPDSALAYFREALMIRRETADRAGEGWTLQSIGLTNRELGRPDSALVYLERARLIWHATGHRAGEAATLHNIAVVQSDLGRPATALVYLRRTLAIHRAIANASGEGRALHDIGSVTSELGRPDTALAYYRQALAIKRRTGDRTGEGITLQNIGVVLNDLGRRDSALTYLRRALAIARETRNRAGEGSALQNIGEVQTKLGRPDTALANLRRALAIHRQTSDREGETMTLSALGLSYARHPTPARRDPARAAAYFDSASAAFAMIRRHAGGDANAISLAEKADTRSLFANWALTWLARARELGDRSAARGALAAVERGRAQALLDLMRQRAHEAQDIAGPVQRITRPPTDLVAELDSLLAPLRASRTAALSYLVADDTLLIWLVAPTAEVRVSRTAVKGDTLAALIAALRSTLGADAARGRMARGVADAAFEQESSGGRRAGIGVGIGTNDAESSLGKLAALLLPKDLEQQVPRGSEIVIVPQGIVGLVPFAALPLGPVSEPLGSAYALRYAPSFAALGADLRAAGTVNLAARSPSGDEPLVAGNPAMPWVRSEAGDSSRLRPLAAAGLEGAWIASQLRAGALTGAAATESEVRRRLPGAPVVHLATHGLAFGTEARVRDSYIALAPDSTNDGLLTMGELLDDPALTLSADLVVLSACQTGLGDLKQAEGTVGLQRAFVARGARSVLVSLWSVDDEATRLLMQRFYTHWLEGRPTLSKAEALRLAQEDVRRTKGYEHPRYWAAFQIVGAR